MTGHFNRSSWPLRTAFAALLAALVGLTGIDSAQAQDIVQPGDELNVRIPEVGGTVERIVLVDSSGEVSLGIYGAVQVGGLSVDDAEAEVRRHLARYLRNTAGVTVTLARRQRDVLVTGQVANPGMLTLEGAADPWLAIQAAGGVAPGGDLSRVLVFREGQEIAVDVRAYLTRDSSEPLPELRLGDTVFVPAEAGMPAVSGTAAPFLGDAALASKVFVLGAVAQPGVYDRSPGLNPLTALALAGGPIGGADLRNVRLITSSGSQRVDLEGWMLGEVSGPAEIPTDGGAIMYVPTRSTGVVTDPFTNPVYLMGELAAPGPFEVDGPTPLVEVLGLTGGYTNLADLEDVYLIQQRERYSLVTRLDLEAYLEAGGGAGAVLVEPGDVVVVGSRPEISPWQTVVTTISELAVISSAVLVWVNLASD